MKSAETLTVIILVSTVNGERKSMQRARYKILRYGCRKVIEEAEINCITLWGLLKRKSLD